MRLPWARRLDRRARLVAVLVVPILALAATWAVRGRQRRTLVMEIAAAMRPRRVFDAQFSEPVAFRVCDRDARPISRADDVCGTRTTEASANSPAVLNAASDVRAAMEGGVDPDAMHAAALVDLFQGAPTRNAIDRSVRYLQTAAHLAPHSAGILVDLSAAYLVRADRDHDSKDLLNAVEAAGAALELDSTSAPARFNLALAEDRFGLVELTRRDWQAAAALEDSTGRGWRGLAWTWSGHQSTDTLATRAPGELDEFASRHPIEGDSLLWQVFLRDWAEATTAENARAAQQALATADTLSETLAHNGVDGVAADAVWEIRAARGAAKSRLAHAYNQYAAARALYDSGHYAEAAKLFDQLLLNAPASSAMRRWTELFGAAARVYIGDAVGGEAALRRLAQSVDASRDALLAGRARWMLGTTELRAGRYADALTDYRRGAAIFSRCGAREYLGAVESLIGSAELDLGHELDAIAWMQKGLNSLGPYRRSVWRHNALDGLVRVASTDGLFRAAARVALAERLAAQDGPGEIYDVEALLTEGLLLARQGHEDSAVFNVREARNRVRRFNGETRAWFLSAAQLVAAEASLHSSPRQALVALDSAIDFLERRPVASRLLSALVARARASMALGRATDAERDLQKAVALLAQQRDHVRQAEYRASLVESARRVFDQLVMLRVNARRPREALLALEEGRAALSDFGPKDPAAGRLLDLPTDQIVLEYSAIGDTLLIWALADTTMRFSRRVVPADTLRLTIRRARASLELHESRAVIDRELTRLYDLLIRPVDDVLAKGNAPVVIVADGEIDAAPFAAMRASDGSYLIDHRQLTFLSSLRDARQERSLATPVATAHALLIGDPAFAATELQSPPRLPGARSEVDTIAQLYDSASVLEDVDATRDAVLQALNSASVVHFAGHAIFDDARPARSFLLLAESGEVADESNLTAEQIASLDLRRLQLVVLSACRTLDSPAMRSGGLAGLAGALLSAGAKGVVGAQWDVADDAATRALMVAFHTRYRASGKAASALREAQLAMRFSADSNLASPAVWAAFRYMGR
ncbi:MAG TPA: CHAT domain-containing protein [Gemmatimonadaceae bacterium]